MLYEILSRSSDSDKENDNVLPFHMIYGTNVPTALYQYNLFFSIYYFSSHKQYIVAIFS